MAKDLDPRFRPPPEAEPAIREVCERLLPVIREAARSCGYAIGVHGSLVRDLDVIAAPWVIDAGGYDDLVGAIHRDLKRALGDGVYTKRFEETGPHGRRWANFYFQARHGVSTPAGVFPFVDLSIMPRILV